jgi:hypothetical protein
MFSFLQILPKGIEIFSLCGNIMWYNKFTRSETVLARSPMKGVRALARKNNNLPHCPVKRATAWKTIFEGLALVLRELKWTILVFVIIAGIIAMSLLGVDLLLVAEIISSTDGLVDLSILPKP